MYSCKVASRTGTLTVLLTLVPFSLIFRSTREPGLPPLVLRMAASESSLRNVEELALTETWVCEPLAPLTVSFTSFEDEL